MLRNYLKIAVRNLLKNSVYSFINIAGLSVGIACTILIALWVVDELTYDHDQPDRDRLYQVWIHSQNNGETNTYTSAPLPLEDELKTADVHITGVAAADWSQNHLLAYNNKPVVRTGFYAAKEFTNMFYFKLIKGSLSLEDPSNLIIGESTAEAMFGDEDPLGKIVRVDNADDLKVSGIIADQPANSSFQFDFLMPFSLFERSGWVKNSRTDWSNHSFPIYVKLQSAGDAKVVGEKIKDVLNKHSTDKVPREAFLYPLERWRLHSRFENGIETGGMMDYVKSFAAIAIFIILIACINFMNLATARSEKRAREVGIRKSIGSQRKELILQFLGESILLSALAFIIGLLLTEICLPLFNGIFQKQLFVPYTNIYFWLSSIGLILVTGIISGSYPAFFLSAFKTVTVLKSNTGAGRSGVTPRRILVTFQFVFSMFAVIGVIAIYEQIQHVKNRDLGYDQKELVFVDNSDDLVKNYDAFKRDLIDQGLASDVTKSNSPITDVYSRNYLGWPGKPDDLKVLFTTIATEYDYTKTMGIRVVQGRDFSREMRSDTTAILLNEAAVELMGLQDPIGTPIDFGDSKRHVVGVIENALMESPFQNPKPSFVFFEPGWVGAITMRLAPTNNPEERIAKIEKVFKKYNPAYPFVYHYADQEFSRKFLAINLIEKLTNTFAALAIIITGLGLFGLAAFTAEQRTKEIGIRKVLGASVSSLIFLISRDFSRLVIVAIVIAGPLGLYFADQYLSKFAYRPTLSFWILPITGAVVFVLSFLIVSTQAFRAARVNPAESLKAE